MARPCKRRRICFLPGFERFGPDSGGRCGAPVNMTVDEFETIRLIDLEGLRQEDCAARMNIARTTVQAVYSSARAKLAECLVNGCELYIEGGDYVLCEGRQKACGDSRPCPHRRAPMMAAIAKNKNEEKSMNKIAVTYENGEVFQHFGHTREFKIYEIKDGQAVSASVADAGECAHEALAVWLRNMGVDTLICGGIGGGARAALAEAGISIFPGANGNADAAAAALLAGSLEYDPDTTCAHHEHHEHNGQCGGHCGE